MKPEGILNQLQEIASSNDFISDVLPLTEEWAESANRFEAVEPVLRFMEQNPGIDYGMPGPLVHFVEDFFGKGYEAKLLDSLARQPTVHTVWMLNRVINGIKKPEVRREMIEALKRAGRHPLASGDTRRAVDGFAMRLRALE